MSLKSMIFRWNPFAIDCFYREWVVFNLGKKEVIEKNISESQCIQNPTFLEITRI